MAIVITREFTKMHNRTIEILPLGDVHLGAAACDEKEFKKCIDYIASNDDTYWIGMGDYCDFINMSDPRFDPASLASWISVSDLKNLATVEKNRFIEMTKPIAHKCLALVKGNHEDVIQRFYEFDIYNSIVTDMKKNAGMDQKEKLGIGTYGYLILKIYMGKSKADGASRNVTINLHHGFTGGRLTGAKALNMQRWLWSHNCDLVIWGHSHNKMTQYEGVEGVNKNGDVIVTPRIGVISGTFMSSTGKDSNTYSEIKGYMPLPSGDIPRIHIHTSTANSRASVKATI